MTSRAEDPVAHTLRVLERDAASIAQDVVARQYALDPATWERFGDEGRRLALRDVGFHLPYLAESLRFRDDAIFVEYCRWLRTLFSNLGFPDDAAATTVSLMAEAVASRVPPDGAVAVRRLAATALRRIDEPAPALESHLDPAAPLAGLARSFLDHLLEGDRHGASRLILDAVDGGADVRDVYLEVFERSQREIGRLWLQNRVSVAQEHFCSAATQLIMSQLYPRVFSTERIGRTMVCTCVHGELHEIGLRMVADFFELEGWDTYYVGANAPDRAVLDAVAERRPHVLAVSAAIPSQAGQVARLVARARESSGDGRLRILVGGNAFLSHPGLWRDIGADGFAVDARDAVRVASSLVAA